MHATVVAVALGVASSPADTVTLSDGSRVIGTVERLGEGKLILKTEFAGTLEIDATIVTSISTDSKVNIGMTTGDRLVGPIRWQPSQKTATINTAMGKVPVQVNDIAAVWPEGAKSPEQLAIEAQVALEKKELEARIGKWSFTLEAGILSKEGNKELVEARGRMELKRKSSIDLLKFYVAGDYGEQNNVRSTAEARGGGYYEYNFTERWFAYTGVEFEYDEFEMLDLRATLTLGGGYYWIREEAQELKTRVGTGYRHESFFSGVTVDDALLDLGLDYRIDIKPWLTFTHATSYQPSVGDFADYRLVFDNALVFPIGDSDMWKFKVGALFEYDNLPAPGVEQLDKTFYGNVVMEIK